MREVRVEQRGKLIGQPPQGVPGWHPAGCTPAIELDLQLPEALRQSREAREIVAVVAFIPEASGTDQLGQAELRSRHLVDPQWGIVCRPRRIVSRRHGQQQLILAHVELGIEGKNVP